MGLLTPPILSALVSLVLVVVAVDDMRRFRIGNGAVLVLLVLACLHVLGSPRAILMAHAAFTGVTLVAMMLAFVAGWIGGGDAKLLVVASLWIGPGGSLPFAVVLLALSVVYSSAALAGWVPAKVVGGRTRIPFGPSIAVAWIATIVAGFAL